jgi:hypothetical protein
MVQTSYYGDHILVVTEYVYFRLTQFDFTSISFPFVLITLFNFGGILKTKELVVSALGQSSIV